MLDYPAYVSAQRRTREVALSALPNAPSVPPPDVPAPQRRRLRRGAALALHRLADRVGS
jgi:hypothetical protein